MSLAPRYGDAPIIAVDGVARDQLAPLVRQRHRLAETLEAIPPDAWRVASRCRGWSVQDVVAHLASVNRFWVASVRAGLAGKPTRMLESFDPVTTPELLVARTRELAPSVVLDDFASSNDELVLLLESLDDRGWSAIAEAPPGHLPVRLLASHALWDAWVHERDVLLPLGMAQPLLDDEVRSSLQYVCALTAATAILAGADVASRFGVLASGPTIALEIELTDEVVVRGTRPSAPLPTLSGEAVMLVEVLSTRVAPLDPLPPAWGELHRPFAAAMAPA